jgi:hypothetical protein
LLIAKSVDKYVNMKMLGYLLLLIIARVLNIIVSQVFQQDNAPIHRGPIVQAFFDQNHITVEDWLAISPDLNPVKNVWVSLNAGFI